MVLKQSASHDSLYFANNLQFVKLMEGREGGGRRVASPLLHFQGLIGNAVSSSHNRLEKHSEISIHLPHTPAQLQSGRPTG